MDYQNILVEQREHVLVITINRAEKLNALNKQTLDELATVLKDYAQNTDIRGVLITGAGEKAFVAGADISEFSSFNVAQGKDLAASGQRAVFDAIENYSKPVIAAINGFALGGGLELAMACHMRIASENARLGLPEVSLGLIPGYGGTQRLAKLVGKGKAMELITTADMIDAKTAEHIGLVNHTVPSDMLIAKAMEIFAKIGQRAPLAVAAAIRAVNASDNADGYQTEIAAFGDCFGTQDFEEGVDAFMNKRKPDFKGK